MSGRLGSRRLGSRRLGSGREGSGREGRSGAHTATARHRRGAVVRRSGALLLVATGAEHLALYLVGGYGQVPTIGLLFLCQALVACSIGLVVLAAPLRLATLGGALFALGTLGGYLLSLGVGLFGFHEVVTAPGIASGLMDIGAFWLLATAATRPAAPSRLPRRRCAEGLAAVLMAFGKAVPPVALTALVAFSIALWQASPVGGIATAANRDVVSAVHVAGYGDVLATQRGRTLYLLRARDGAQAACRGGCLSIWPPLLVASSVRRLHAGPGVHGALGLVPRDGRQQVTFNGYRLYTYAGDSAPKQDEGEGIASFGGTWYLVRATAARPVNTAVPGKT